MSESRRHATRRAASAGFSLVELLVAMVVGLFLLAGVISIFVNSRESFRVNENLSRVQENSRFSFEILMREIREAGIVPCGMPFTSPRMANVVAATPPWWADWAGGTLVGYDGGQAAPAKATGTGATARVAGTDAITVLRPVSDESAIQLVSAHAAGSNQFTVPSARGFAAGDVVIACDKKDAALLKVSGIGGSPPVTVSYGTTGPAANCSANLGYPTGTCGATSPGKTVEAGGMLVKFDPVFWYVGYNASGGKSLYRIQLTKTAGAPTPEAQEMVSNVTDMQIEYLTRDGASGGTLATAWVPANHAVFAGGWSLSNTQQVVAVRIALTFESEEKVNGAPLQRKFIAVSALRNRDRL